MPKIGYYLHMKLLNMPPYPSRERQLAVYRELKAVLLGDMIFMEKSMASGDSRHTANLIKAKIEFKRLQKFLEDLN